MNHISNYLTDEEFKNIINDPNEYNKALSLVTLLFKEKVDKEGMPYIGHLKRVSDSLDNPKTKIAGLLHDTVEDIDGITYEDLLNIGFDKDVVEMVKLVTTEDKTKPYHDKITSIIESGNIEAIKLKYADMSDNYNKERLSTLNQETRKKLEAKYENEIIRLKETLERR